MAVGMAAIARNVDIIATFAETDGKGCSTGGAETSISPATYDPTDCGPFYLAVRNRPSLRTTITIDTSYLSD